MSLAGSVLAGSLSRNGSVGASLDCKASCLERVPSAGCFRRAASAPARGAPRLRIEARAAGEPQGLQGGDGRSADELRRQLEALWSRHTAQDAQPSGEVRPATHALSDEQPSTSGSDLRWDTTWDFIDGDAATPFSPTFFRQPSMDGTLEDNDVSLWSSSNPSALLFGSAGLWAGLDQVYVILFGVGQNDTEGIYSLRALTREDGLPLDTILAFEHPEDADRYAGLLEATMEHVPSVCPIDPSELLDFCLESGYSCRLEAHGSLLIPPDYNVNVTDWERTLRLREGRYSVLEASEVTALQELARRLQSPMAADPGLLPIVGFGLDELLGTAPLAGGLEDLNEVKRRLERLLPED